VSMTSKEEPSGTEKLRTSSLDELAANTLPVGTVLQERYEILGILGLGGGPGTAVSSLASDCAPSRRSWT